MLVTLWFLRGLRRGVVTTGYPTQPDSSAANLPTPPLFHAESLDRVLADRLSAICPSGALHRDGDTLVFDLGACTACGRCQEVGQGAVTASGEFELTATSRALLVKRIPLLREASR